jgi:hypothetical protein
MYRCCRYEFRRTLSGSKGDLETEAQAHGPVGFMKRTKGTVKQQNTNVAQDRHPLYYHHQHLVRRAQLKLGLSSSHT